jgi:hypothetical protein
MKEQTMLKIVNEDILNLKSTEAICADMQLKSAINDKIEQLESIKAEIEWEMR